MAKYKIRPTGQFKKDLKLAKKRGLSLDDLFAITDLLEETSHFLKNAEITNFMATMKAAGSVTSTLTGC